MVFMILSAYQVCCYFGDGYQVFSILQPLISHLSIETRLGQKLFSLFTSTSHYSNSCLKLAMIMTSGKGRAGSRALQYHSLNNDNFKVVQNVFANKIKKAPVSKQCVKVTISKLHSIQLLNRKSNFSCKSLNPSIEVNKVSK